MDVDGTDAALFKTDFGRSGFNNPCPDCEVGDWCLASECEIPANLLLTFAGGDGSAGDPYVICTGQQLSNVRN